MKNTQIQPTKPASITTNNVQSITNKTVTNLPSTTLSTKNLFNHYFLIHDFLFRLVKTTTNSNKLFDLQIEVNNQMRHAAKQGGKMGQISMFGFLLVYCLKGKSIKLKLLSGFLYIYWIDHFYTLGSYTGLLLKMPSIYKKTGEYFLNNQPLNQKNIFLRLENEISKNEPYEQTQDILCRIFDQQIKKEQNYVVNDFFAKNKDKYFNQQSGTSINKPNLKLKYMDCFLTRYVYYSFTRWCNRRLVGFGLKKNDF